MNWRNERTCIELLKELARDSEGFLSLKHIQDSRPELHEGISKFIEEDYVHILYERCADSSKFLLYDQHLCALIVDDPQLVFYLSNTPTERLRAMAGKVPNI